MLVAAAVLPAPPVTPGGAAAWSPSLREAAGLAVDQVLAAEPELLGVVTSGPTTGPVELAAATGSPGLALAAELVERSGHAGLVAALQVAADADGEDCRRLGAELADRADRVVLLVVAGAWPAAPAGQPAGAVSAVTDEVRHALSAADAPALLALDATVDAILPGGRGPWQVLAGAADEDDFDAAELVGDEGAGVAGVPAARLAVEGTGRVVVWEHHG